MADERVLAAIAAVRRERFVPADLADRAYENTPLPIGGGQTISQPLVIAHMCELLAVAPAERVLDVGTGSGYHAAVLARLAAHVWTIEVRTGLVGNGLSEIDNVTCATGDGLTGLPEHAPFDAINVAAAGEEEDLAALLDQLGPGGRLVAPVGGRVQILVRYERAADGLRRTEHGRVSFVPLMRPGR